MKKRFMLCLLSAIICGGTVLTADEWQLKSISGHLPAFWDNKAPNWKWEDGNPAKDGEAEWLLFYQTDNDPALGATVKPLQKGLAWKYNYVWRDDSDKADPLFYYIDRSLICGGRADFGSGPASGLMFTPAGGGTFNIELNGKVKVQNPTAGNAKVSIYLLDQKNGNASLLQEYELNNKGGHGNFPEDFKWSQSVTIPAGSGIAVRVQSVNPGPASAGKSTLSFSIFKIVKK